MLIKANDEKGINIYLVIIIGSILFIGINVFFFPLKSTIDYFVVISDFIILLTTFFLITAIPKHSIIKGDFYYFVNIGLALLFFGLLILTCNNLFAYPGNEALISVKLLFVFGYCSAAIGFYKWIKFNQFWQEELFKKASIDNLTGALNRRAFTKYVRKEFDKVKIANTDSHPFSLIVIDIDFFKGVNDNYGHMIGDEVLKNLSNFMKLFFRAEDKICRWGGEEFAILLPNTSLENASIVAEKIRKNVEYLVFEKDNISIIYTISLGVSEVLNSDEEFDDVINRADDALYLAKNDNRNCVRSIKV